MTVLFPFLVVAIVLAFVARSMIGLTRLAAGSGRLRPMTVTILTYAPLAVLAPWVLWLFWRMTAPGGGFSLWPFELAVAVILWLAWTAIVALVVTVHAWALRLLRRDERDPPET